MTTSHTLAQKAQTYLHKLCLEIPTRRMGSQGNRRAVEFAADILASFGFDIQPQEFDCLEWPGGEANLEIAGESFDLLPGPYTLPCGGRAPLIAAGTLADLQAVEASESLLLLHGDLAAEQLMPKNFPFYNPAEHQRIVALLEAKKPLAIVAATARNPELAGALYPFPLIEDGDFDIPNAYTTEEAGERLRGLTGQLASLEIVSERIASRGANIVARRGARWDRRIVLFAHIDAKPGTPGALDNAAGVVALLMLAELLAGYDGALGVEIVFLNGEDDYSAMGEKEYLQANGGKFEDIVLGINLDGAGYHAADTAYSLYDCPASIADLIGAEFSDRTGFIEGQPWYQSDHSLFLMQRVPAMAITSADFTRLWTQIAHTPDDLPELVDPMILVEIASALHNIIIKLA